MPKKDTDFPAEIHLRTTSEQVERIETFCRHPPDGVPLSTSHGVRTLIELGLRQVERRKVRKERR